MRKKEGERKEATKKENKIKGGTQKQGKVSKEKDIKNERRR
jgi:hypothetical protein